MQCVWSKMPSLLNSYDFNKLLMIFFCVPKIQFFNSVNLDIVVA